MTSTRTTLAQFLSDQAQADADLATLILNIAGACTAISARVSSGALSGALGKAEDAQVNVQGETQQKLDVIANDVFVDAVNSSGAVAGMVSEELDDPYVLPADLPRGKYLLCFDPLDGSSNIDVNVSVGSIFSIVRAAEAGQDPALEAFLLPGTEQVCGGYAIYGPSTMLMLTLGDGVHGFTLDPGTGEYILTRRNIRIPERTSEWAINMSNQRFWEPAVARYVSECVAGTTGPRERDFNMRWIASLVAETHRILTRGGVFMYPRDRKDPSKPGRLRLLYEANPISFIIEQAGGRATTGSERILDVAPTEIHQRIGLIFGSAEEVERIENYHSQPADEPVDIPLYGERGLFRAGRL